jgi:hypothetical protein
MHSRDVKCERALQHGSYVRLASATHVSRAAVDKVKLLFTIEINETALRSGIMLPIVSGDNAQQVNLPCRISANFVTQLVATFLPAPQTCLKRRTDLRDAIRSYHGAVTPKRLLPGITICRKT